MAEDKRNLGVLGAGQKPARVREPVEVMVFRLDQPIIITIDGPAGTGKSTVAHQLARRLGLWVLDTGAMYRVATAIALEQQIPLEHVKRLLEVVRSAHVRFDWKCEPPAIQAFGKSYAKRVREPDVTAAVGAYAGVDELRKLMVGMQRDIAREHPRLVTEGRDQGSVVFPHATVKFYLDASADVRAQRRREQLLREQGAAPEFEQLRAEIEARDARDRARPYGALVCPEDAEVVDTSGLSMDEVVETLRERVIKRSRGPAED